MREQAAAALPAHTMEEVPETQHTGYTWCLGCHILTTNKYSYHHGNYDNNNIKRQQHWRFGQLTIAAPEPRHQ